MATCTSISNIKSIEVLSGHWKPLEGGLESCIIEVTKDTSSYVGRIKRCPFQIALFGWIAGDIKWKISKNSTREYRLIDLSIAYDCDKGEPIYKEHSQCIAKVNGDILTITDSNDERCHWKKIVY